jgi:ABC-type Mn2+/Zn2+ transport system ATPase subunit
VCAPTAGPPVVTFADVTVGYRGIPVREHVTLEVRRGDFLGIAGANGAGKTTILRTLLGLNRPLAGRVEHVTRLPISYVPQRERIDTIVPVTALEVALMGRLTRASPFRFIRHHDRDHARRALARVGIEDLAPRLYRELSGGQQQLVLLARALAGDPELLVLDEPTTAMDLASEHALIELLRDENRARGLTVVLVTHLLSVLLNVATSVLLLEADRILAGPTEQVLREETLSELYGVPVTVTTVRGRRTLVVGRSRE